MKAREVIQRLRREGWTETPGRGSHIVFRKDGRMTIVSNHPGDLPTGTLRSICKQTGWEWPPSK